MPDGFCALFLPAEILPASLLTPPVLPVPVPIVLLPAALPGVDPLVVEPVAPVLAAGPPAPELPPPLCANAKGPATTSAAAKAIIAGFIMSFPCLL